MPATSLLLISALIIFGGPGWRRMLLLRPDHAVTIIVPAVARPH